MEPRGAAATALLDLSEQTIDGPAVRPEELLNRRPQSAASERSAASEIPPSPVEPPAPPPPGPPSSAIDGEAALLAKLPRGEASVLSQVAPHLDLFAALALASACVALRGSALAAAAPAPEPAAAPSAGMTKRGFAYAICGSCCQMTGAGVAGGGGGGTHGSCEALAGSLRTASR